MCLLVFLAQDLLNFLTFLVRTLDERLRIEEQAILDEEQKARDFKQGKKPPAMKETTRARGAPNAAKSNEVRKSRGAK